jgi:hypothetical protein
MAIQRRPAGEAPEWTSVSVGRPCPRCGATAGCAVADDAGAVRCQGIVSPHPVAGGGWFHALQQRRRPDEAN